MAKSNADESKGEMSVYLLFHQGGRLDKSGHTFFKIDLRNSSSSSSSVASSESPVSINPILEFSPREYPHRMACAQLGSKLYFFGGYCLQPPSPPHSDHEDERTIELLNQALPPYVYILDTAASAGGGGTSNLIKRGPRMASGKMTPIVFVAKGMIYALSAGRSVRSRLALWESNPQTWKWNAGNLMSPVKLFERYDPVENKWKVLDDSPLHSLSYLRGYILMEDQHKVVITALSGNERIHLVYDLDQDLWLSSSSLIPIFEANHLLFKVNYGPCQYVGGFCYGVAPTGVSQPMKFGPFHLKKDEEVDSANSDKFSLSTMSLVDPHDVFPLVHGLDGRCMLKHLGGGYFFYVCSSHALIDNDVDIPDPYTRVVIITIFKEVEAEELPTGRESSQVATPSSFKAKIVFSQNYVFKTDYECGGELLSCFLVQSSVPTIIKPFN